VGEPAHRLRLLRDALPPERIEPLILDDGNGYVPIEQCVVRLEDALLRAFAKEAFDLVAA